jgi:small nuclear ribonucleoprotein (snRNP)-like protein
MDNNENKLQLKVPDENKISSSDSEEETKSESEETKQLFQQIFDRYVNLFIKSAEEIQRSDDDESSENVEDDEHIEDNEECIEKVEQDFNELVIDLQEENQKEDIKQDPQKKSLKIILQKMIRKICGSHFF